MNIKKLYRSIILIFLLVIVIAAGVWIWGKKKPMDQSAPHRLTVVTSFYPLYFFAQAIGGGGVKVVNITPAGSEPHDYEPTPADMVEISQSDLLILNGGGLEAWGGKLQNILQGSRVHIVIAGESLTTGHVEEEGKTITDPHIWLAPALAKREAASILAGYIQVDPAHAAIYRGNAAKLDLQLDQLDTDYRGGLAHCDSQDIITSHAAFGYLAQAYGLHQVPISGLSPDAEPSPKQLALVTQYARDHGVRYIFFESLVSPKLSQVIATEVGVQTLVLDPIEGVSEMDMRKGVDYLTIMHDDLTSLHHALICQ